jgi:general secretion pathway protein J
MIPSEKITDVTMIKSRPHRWLKTTKLKIVNGHSGGFTLLELVIALTIVTVIVVIIFGALRIGIRAWEKGEKDVDIRQRQRIVLDLIKRQLASTSVNDVRTRDQQLVPIKGDSKSIEFISQISLTPGNQDGMVFVKYDVKHEKEGDKERLTYYERSIALPDKKMGAANLEEGDFSELMSGMKSIVFEYLKEQSGEAASRWQKNWDPEVDKGVPRAVRITLEEDGEKHPIYVIAGAGE